MRLHQSLEKTLVLFYCGNHGRKTDCNKKISERRSVNYEKIVIAAIGGDDGH